MAYFDGLRETIVGVAIVRPKAGKCVVLGFVCLPIEVLMQCLECVLLNRSNKNSVICIQVV